MNLCVCSPLDSPLADLSFKGLIIMWAHKWDAKYSLSLTSTKVSVPGNSLAKGKCAPVSAAAVSQSLEVNSLLIVPI